MSSKRLLDHGPLIFWFPYIFLCFSCRGNSDTITKLNLRRFIILILSISILVSALVVWSQVYVWAIKPLPTKIYHNSDRRQKLVNPAMTTCIEYVSLQTTDVTYFCENRMSNTIIIGVAKCGTQALLAFLGQHPKIVRNTDINDYPFFNLQYTKGLEWYRDRMPYSLPGQVVIGRTPAYFENELVPKRIFNINPKMKLLLAVRNPVDRAVSAYAMHKSIHVIHSKTIKGVKPVDIFPPFELIWKQYLNIFYDTSLEHWLHYFRIEQIHIVDGDVLRKSPLQELKKIEQFLNVEPYFHDKQFYLNTTRRSVAIVGTDDVV